MLQTWLDSIARAVQSARENRGLNQTEVSKLSHVSRKTISEIENARNYHIQSLFQVLTALKIDPWQLLGGEEPKSAFTANSQYFHVIHQLVSILDRKGKAAEWIIGNIATFYKSGLRVQRPKVKH